MNEVSETILAAAADAGPNLAGGLCWSGGRRRRGATDLRGSRRAMRLHRVHVLRELRRHHPAHQRPVRLRIVNRLAIGPATAGELAEPFAISRPAISRHLRVLREAGIAHADVRGREWWYALNPTALTEVQTYLEEVKRMWRTTLGAFKAYVEEET